MIKIDIRIKWNKTFRDEIEKKLNKRKIKKIAIKIMKSKFNTKTKWN
jgi:hypothetical protein